MAKNMRCNIKIDQSVLALDRKPNFFLLFFRLLNAWCLVCNDCVVRCFLLVVVRTKAVCIFYTTFFPHKTISSCTFYCSFSHSLFVCVSLSLFLSLVSYIIYEKQNYLFTKCIFGYSSEKA